MLGLVSWLIVIAGFVTLLLLFLFYRFPANTKHLLHKVIPPLTTALAIWGLCTSWFWFYFFNLMLSLPALLLAIGLNAYATYKGLNPNLVRVNSIAILSAFVLGLLSYFWFDI
jgi:hypothetical protein